MYLCVGCGKELEQATVCKTCFDRAVRKNRKDCPVCGMIGIRHRHAHVKREFEEVQTCGFCGSTVHKVKLRLQRYDRGADVPFYPGRAEDITDNLAVTVRARGL
jgi:hypothetical protein